MLTYGALGAVLSWSFTTLAVAAKNQMTSVPSYLLIETAFTVVQWSMVAPLTVLASARWRKRHGVRRAAGARIRRVLGARPHITERRMFGGLAFLHDGRTRCGVVGDDLVVRVVEDEMAAALGRPHVRPMDFTGRPLRGFVYVAAPAIPTGGAAGVGGQGPRVHRASCRAEAPCPFAVSEARLILTARIGGCPTYRASSSPIRLAPPTAAAPRGRRPRNRPRSRARTTC